MSIQQTKVIDGYIYGVSPDSGRGDALDTYAALINYASNWESFKYIDNAGNPQTQQAFISTNKAESPTYWANAKNIVTIVGSQVNAMLQELIVTNPGNKPTDTSWPISAEVMLSLAPPGNMQQIGPSGGEVNVYNTGALWNVWASYMKLQYPDEDINNFWNNTYAQWKLPSSVSSKFTAPPAYDYKPPDSTPKPTYVQNFTTVPITGTPGQSSNPPKEDGKSWPVASPDIVAPLPVWVEKDHKILEFKNATKTELEDDSSFRDFLVQSIYDFRNLSLPEFRAAVSSLTGEIKSGDDILYSRAQILKRPGLQDTVFFQYALTGEGNLQRELGTVTDQMKIAEQVITALNTIATLISQSVNVDRKLQAEGASGKGALLSNKSYLLSGYAMLKEIYDSGLIQDKERQKTVCSVLQRASATVSLFKAIPAQTATNSTVVSAAKQLAHNAFFSWWGGNEASSLNNSALTMWENQNTTLKNNLKKAVFVYQEFIKSASSVMRKLNQMVKSAAQDIRGR